MIYSSVFQLTQYIAIVKNFTKLEIKYFYVIYKFISFVDCYCGAIAYLLRGLMLICLFT